MSRYNAPVNQLTIRGFDDDLARHIRELARRDGISLNRAAVNLIRRGAELDVPDADVVGSSLDHLAGTWTDEEADRIDQALADFDCIDEEIWTRRQSLRIRPASGHQLPCDNLLVEFEPESG